MPNFVSLSLKNKKYPIYSNGVEFLWLAKSKNESLVYSKVDEDEFFLMINNRKDDYLIKADKLTRPTNLISLKKALIEFKNIHCSGIKFDTTSIQNKSQLKQDEFVKTEKDLLEILKSKKYNKIIIEIGFGSGRHLLFLAKTNSDSLVIGIEVYKPAISQVANLAIISFLKNILLINSDARLVMSLLNSNLVDKIFLHFPVPWENSEKRRVISKIFVTECQRILKKDGKFELRSDNLSYSKFAIDHLLNLESSNIQIYKNRFLEVSSKYEDRWVRQNKDIYDVIFTNNIISPKLNLKGEFSFNNVNATSLKNRFKNITFKKNDYFVHIEKLYEKEDGGLLFRVALGSFYRPEHCYILIENDFPSYFIKKPLLTLENLKAHNVLKEYLACKI